MTVRRVLSLLILAAATASGTAPASAAPLLKPSIVVTGDLVTAGDLFENAGDAAETPLFRAPAPGTVGAVDLAAIQRAALIAGIGAFDAGGMHAVRVERTGVLVDADMLTHAIADALTARGLIDESSSLALDFDTPLGRLFAADTGEPPVALADLAANAVTGRFAARLVVPGHRGAIPVAGRFVETVPAPHLVASLAKDAVIRPADVEMRPVPLRRLGADPALGLEDVVGMAVRRSIRAGNFIGPSDIVPPTVVARNDAVTLVYRTGPLTLTVHGQALGDAAVGEPVAVLNPMSRRVIHGIVAGPGQVFVDQVVVGPLDASPAAGLATAS